MQKKTRAQENCRQEYTSRYIKVSYVNRLNLSCGAYRFRAALKASPGKIIVIKPGVYEETLLIEVIVY